MNKTTSKQTISLIRYIYCLPLLFLAVFLTLVIRGDIPSMRDQAVNVPILSYLVKERNKAVVTAKATKLSFRQPAFDALAQAIILQVQLNEIDAKEYRDYYIQGTEDFPRFSDLHYMLGVVYGQMGDIERSLGSLAKAAELNPHFFWPAYNLGVLYFQNKDHDKAIEWLTKATQCPVEPSLRYIYASRVFVQIFWQNKKIQNLPLQQNLVNAHIKSYRMLSESYQVIGKDQESQAYLMKFQEAKEKHPQFNLLFDQTNFIFF